jgi:hypothetical protein
VLAGKRIELLRATSSRGSLRWLNDGAYFARRDSYLNGKSLNRLDADYYNTAMFATIDVDSEQGIVGQSVHMLIASMQPVALYNPQEVQRNYYDVQYTQYDDLFIDSTLKVSDVKVINVLQGVAKRNGFTHLSKWSMERDYIVASTSLYLACLCALSDVPTHVVLTGDPITLTEVSYVDQKLRASIAIGLHLVIFNPNSDSAQWQSAKEAPPDLYSVCSSMDAVLLASIRKGPTSVESAQVEYAKLPQVAAARERTAAGVEKGIIAQQPKRQTQTLVPAFTKDGQSGEMLYRLSMPAFLTDLDNRDAIDLALVNANKPDQYDEMLAKAGRSLPEAQAVARTLGSQLPKLISVGVLPKHATWSRDGGNSWADSSGKVMPPEGFTIQATYKAARAEDVRAAKPMNPRQEKIQALVNRARTRSMQPQRVSSPAADEPGELE